MSTETLGLARTKPLEDLLKAVKAWRESDRIRMGRPRHGVLTVEEEELIRRLYAWVG